MLDTFRFLDTFKNTYKLYFNLTRERYLKNDIKTIDALQLPNCEKIEFINVDYRHNSTSNYLFKNLSYTFEKNRYYLINPSGHGKTTLFDLICGLIKPTAGTILGYHNGKPEQKESFNSLISVVPQEIMLFDMSIRWNITFSKDDPDAKLIEILFGNVDLDKNANQLSIGQKQRVLIARALHCYNNYSIFLFDEYLSHVDIEIKTRIHNYVMSLLRDKIVIFITHDTLLLELDKEKNIFEM